MGTALCIFNKVVDGLKRRVVDISQVTGLGFDRARVITGAHSGVVTLSKKESPFSIQVHCVAHRVPLIAADT